MNFYFKIGVVKTGFTKLYVIFVVLFAKIVFGQFDFNQVKNVVENVVDFMQQTSENVNCEFQCPSGKLLD